MSENNVVKIDQKIASVALADKTAEAAPVAAPAPVVPARESLHEKVKRPEVLEGRTYKLKSGNSQHSLYLTINHMVLNKGTPEEEVRPFEIFINSKDMSSYPWIAALTTLASAVFRKGGDVLFIVDELKSIVDPSGGYFSAKARGMTNLVAEIGMTIEEHFKHIGLIKTEPKPVLDASVAAFVEEKKAAYTAAGGSFDHATDCKKCGEKKSVIVLDKCPTCTACGDSKCG